MKTSSPKLRLSVRPEAHSASIRRFRRSKSDGFQETDSISDTFYPQIGRFVLAKMGRYGKWVIPFQSIFFCEIPKSHIPSCVIPTGANKYQEHSRNWVRAPKAEGASVLSYPFFVWFHSWKGGLKNNFPKLRLSVQKPIALLSVDVTSPKVMGSKEHIPKKSWERTLAPSALDARTQFLLCS